MVDDRDIGRYDDEESDMNTLKDGYDQMYSQWK